MLDFLLLFKLRKNWLVSWKTRKVYEQNGLRLITRCCEWNILQRHEKCQFCSFGDGAAGPDEAKNIKWLLTRLENHFKSNQMCFYSNLGKSFSCQSFRQNYFLSEIEWVVLRETTSSICDCRHNLFESYIEAPLIFMFSRQLWEENLLHQKVLRTLYSLILHSEAT